MEASVAISSRMPAHEPMMMSYAIQSGELMNMPTERKIELDEGTIEMLNRRYRRLMDTLDSRPTVSITYFRPDERKEGGAYLTVTGVVRKLDPAARRIIMQDGTVIPAAEISAMEGEIFSDMNEW